MPKLPSSSFNTEKAAKLLGGRVNASLSRIKLAHCIDEIYMRGILLFDSSSITRMDKFLIKYARLKLFQKVQTAFQMGKKDELLELLSYIRSNIDSMIEYVQDPNCFMTVSGKLLDPGNVKEQWRKPLPKWLVQWISNTSVWKELEQEVTGKIPNR